jgi:ADP-heptose:LPS heptosyltransferase
MITAQQIARDVVSGILPRHPVIIGGIGDILLSLEAVKKEPVVWLYSHYKDAEKLVKPFCAQVNFKYYENAQQLYAMPGLSQMRLLERHTYPRFEIPDENYKEAENIADGHKGKLIGIHPFGSKFANTYHFKMGNPIKNMTNNFVVDLIDKKNTYLVFGTEEELKDWELPKNCIKVSGEIWTSLALVTFCDYLICADSAIKTMASISKKPTICLIGDYEDQWRDNVFIKPYLGKLIPVKFTELNEDILKEVKKHEANILRN